MPRAPRTLAEELQQSRPFSSVSEEAVVAVLRTAALMRRALSRRIESRGISVAQYNVLRILRGAGPEGLPTLAVRDRLIEEAPGITRLIDKLERSRLVARLRDREDRRTVRCRITPAGLALLDELEAGVRETHGLLTEALPRAEERRALVALLGRVRAVLGEDEAPETR